MSEIKSKTAIILLRFVASLHQFTANVRWTVSRKLQIIRILEGQIPTEVPAPLAFFALELHLQQAMKELPATVALSAQPMR